MINTNQVSEIHRHHYVECWFCQRLIHKTNKIISCPNLDCCEFYVNYYLDNNEPHNAQFTATLSNNRKYIIEYYPSTKTMVVDAFIRNFFSDKKSPGWEIKNVFSAKYDSLYLTPQNVEKKLPLLIAFS